jgi:hypothetical protein
VEKDMNARLYSGLAQSIQAILVGQILLAPDY